MRLALLSAQKLSSQIESEARQRADSLVADAQAQADQIHKQAEDSIANENAKLEEAQKATAKFFDHMRTVCQKQIEFYDKLGQMTLVGDAAPAPAPQEEAETDAAVQRAEEMVRSMAASAREAAQEQAPEADEEVPEEADEPTRLYPTAPARNSKKKRSFDDFSFDDDI